MNGARVAVVHDWLTGMRGGEKVLEAVIAQLTRPEIFTLLANPSKLSPTLRELPIHQSWLGRLPGVTRYYRHLLPLMPRAIESFRFKGFDLVFSSSHCVAKGVIPPRGVPHVCYCHTPMRYAWHMRAAYLAKMSPAKRALAHVLLDQVRDWDRRTARRVTHFIANSRTVQQRIRDAYGRDSVVIPPPVATDVYTPAKVRREDYYLVVSALVPYKRIDLAVAACQQLKRPLVVIGTGEEEANLRRLANGWVTFAGWQTNEAIRDHLRKCRALLFPGEEDFGIVPVEANACGAPVIAFGRGGATETIVPLDGTAPPTGEWFHEPNVESLIAAMQRLEKQSQAVSPLACRQNALRFSAEQFHHRLAEVLAQVMGGPVPSASLRRAA